MDNAEFRVNLAKHFSDDWEVRASALPIATWDVSRVTDMSGAFAHKDCDGIDFSAWDTRNVTNMGSMFYGASCIDEASLESLDTRNVTTMQSMFFMVQVGFNPDLSKWDTSNVVDMGNMFDASWFYGTGLQGWNTSNVKNMTAMFCDCDDGFTDDLTKWDVSNVTEMVAIFNNAWGVKCDVSQWDTRNVTDVDFSIGPAALWFGGVESSPSFTEEEYAKDRFVKQYVKATGGSEELADACWWHAKLSGQAQEFYSYYDFRQD